MALILFRRRHKSSLLSHNIIKSLRQMVRVCIQINASFNPMYSLHFQFDIAFFALCFDRTTTRKIDNTASNKGFASSVVPLSAFVFVYFSFSMQYYSEHNDRINWFLVSLRFLFFPLSAFFCCCCSIVCSLY